MKRKIAALIITGLIAFQTPTIFAADLSGGYNPNSSGNTNEIHQNTNDQGIGNQNTGLQNPNNQNAGTQNPAGGSQTNHLNIIPDSLNNRTSNENGRLNLGSDTYIMQDGDALWLIMGHIKAKLDVLLYIDPTNANNNASVSADDKNFFGIPIYR